MANNSKLLVACAAAVTVSAGVYCYHLYQRRLEWHAKIRQSIEDLQQLFGTPTEKLLQVAEVMKEEMVAGLKGKPGACLKMLPSYVDNLPDGTEKGVFYALDLGGTNFRVMRVLLKGKEGGVAGTEAQSGVITPELMTGDKEALFDMMAIKLATFVHTEMDEYKPAEGHHRELGFTFSFPCDQTAINSGKLIRWTKGFNIPSMEGQDVVRLLEEAIARQGLEIKVTALVNDTVGTLAGARYYDPDVDVAVILGTGTNACYEEKQDTSFRLVGPPPASGHMVINMEWGNFNSELLNRTQYDRELCDKSPNPNEQHLEKVTSGMYLGEIVRLILVDIHQQIGLFNGRDVKIYERLSLSTPNVSKIHADTSASLSTVGDILKKTFKVSTTQFQRQTVKEIVNIVTTRAARLVAACLAGVLKKINKDKGDSRVVIAVDGGLYENYTEYKATLISTLKELLGVRGASTVELVLSKDGSGIGSALLAASHSAYSWK